MRSAATPVPVQRVIEEFSRLPGVGPKSASRLAFYLLRSKGDQTEALANALLEMKLRTRFCSTCFNITIDELDPCAVCRDEQRSPELLCVVEDPLDVIALDRTGLFKGRYHVLHGALSPVDGVGPEDLKIKELLTRVQQGGFKEIIIATNPNLSGQATAMYLNQHLVQLGVKVTRPAQGLPVGGDLEYADETTLARALEGRTSM